MLKFGKDETDFTNIASLDTLAIVVFHTVQQPNPKGIHIH